MKHFKKVLALCVSLALLLSVCPMALAADSAAFTDISGTTHAHAIQVLAAAGIVNGIGGGKFDPDGSVDRATAATVLHRLAGKPTTEASSKFEDVKDGAWYAATVNWASETGIVQGDGAGHFFPDSPVTGEQMELMLSRLAERIGVDYSAVVTSKEPLNRGELAEMAYVLYTMMGDCVFATDGTLYIVGYDAGPSVDKVIVTLPEAVDAVSAEGAAVATAGTERKVTGVVLSDEKGNPVEGTSKYVTLTLEPVAGGLFVEVPDAHGNSLKEWVDAYVVSAQFSVELNGESKTASLNANCIGSRIAPEADKFTMGTYSVDNTNPMTDKTEKVNIHYASYAPDTLKNDGAKNPLVIWLHGAGEGGSDPSFVLLSNEAADLAGETIQNYFTTEGGQKGAYVLVPQTETVWMDQGDGVKSWGDVETRYSEALMAAIEQYVADNGDIDASRIYIGGCSNGGYMAVNMMIKYPDYWAAAFPVCSVYPYNVWQRNEDGSYVKGSLDRAFPAFSFPPYHPSLDSYVPSDVRWTTDEDIETIKDIPVWFVHAASDPVVTPDYTSMSVYRALVKAGATNAWYSLFEHALNTDLVEKSTATFGHAVWQNLFNDQVKRVQNVDAIKNSAADDKTMGFVPSDETGGGSASNGYDSLFAWLNAQKNTNTKVIVTGTQQVVLKAEDGGPVVYKTIVHLDKAVDADSVTKESLKVVETRETFSWATFTSEIVSEAREITDAYPCDELGNKVETDSSYIAVEMTYDSVVGYPYATVNEQSVYSDVYALAVSLGSGKLATANGTAIDKLSVGKVDLSKALIPELDKVDLTGKFEGTDGKTLTYASYAPDNAADGQKHPLVIWIHGMGEGGTDPSIAMLGNEVTALIKDQFQSLMGGAYVLVPQTDGFWLRYDENDPTKWMDNPGVKSIYTDTLMELIKSYVAANPAIDTDRIIIGGCSNGGYMTMNMIIQYPDYFAAAYPICEAYEDSGITDEQMESIKGIPIWFVWAEDDFLVDPTTHEKPTIERLTKLGAEVHSSVFETGGHASWVYFFNNECVEGDVNMWQWMSQQGK